MGKKPKSSTLMNFASELNRVVQTAVDRALISEHVPVPVLKTSQHLIGKLKLVAMLKCMHSGDPELGTVTFDSVLGRKNLYLFSV